MSQWSSQVLQRLFRIAHAAVSIALALVIVITASAGALVWRLSQGTIDLAWLTPRLGSIINGAARDQFHIDSVALAWEGWRGGVDRPLDLQLRGITAADGNGKIIAKIPEAKISLSFTWLIFGRLVPRAIEIDQPTIELLRTADNAVLFGAIDHADPQTEIPSVHTLLLALLGGPISPRPRGGAGSSVAQSRWSELRRIRVVHANAVLIDRAFGTSWRFPQANFDLRRSRDGAIGGSAEIVLMLADRSVQLHFTGSVGANRNPKLQARFGPVDLDVLAHEIPQLKQLTAAHGRALGTLDIDLDPAFHWHECVLQAEVGQGTVELAGGSVPILGAKLDLDLFPTQGVLRLLRLTLDGSKGAAPVMKLHGRATREDQRFVGSLGGDLDTVDVADLGRFWPAGLAKGAQTWVTRNVTAGRVNSAHVELGFETALDGSDAVLTSATANASAEDLTIHWLRPMPPVEHAKADLSLLSPDSLVIRSDGGRLAWSGPGPILIRSGSMKVTGLMERDQFGTIEVNVASSLADALALLRDPSLRLLDRHPLELRTPSGQVTAHIGLHLWLDERVTFDSIPIRASAELHHVHLAEVLHRQNLTDGDLELNVTNDGMQLEGTGFIAGIPAEYSVQMDFRAGPSTQIRTRYTIAGSILANELSSLGVDLSDGLRGRLGIRATVLEKRDGSGEADIQADLQQAELLVSPLGWQKRTGQPATATAHVILDHDRITSIDRLSLAGEALSVDAAVQFVGNHPALVRLTRAMLGYTSGTGEIVLAAAAGSPIRVKLIGNSLDLTDRFKQPGAAGHHGGSIQSPWFADLKFDRVVLGPNRMLSDVTAQLQDDGAIVRQARITGRLDGGGQFAILLASDQGEIRRLTVDSSNAGSLLRALDIMSTLDGGHLVLTARSANAAGADPLFGDAEITSFRLREAPAATRLLEAMTLYGLATALRDPGLEISRLVAPFRLSNSVLELNNVRAFSASLGFTAKGRIDLDQRTADIDGTIVPAYFFNSLFGRIPVIGNLFSPEKGGGMFAATYRIRGRLDNPEVSVNPLAALTPGFLRGLFGVLH